MPSSYTIGGHFENFIKEQVEGGSYASASEVIRDGLRLLVSTGVILTHPTGVKVTHLGEDGGFAEAADVDPGANSGDTSHGATGRGIEGDRAASGMFA